MSSVSSLRSVEREESRGVFDAIVVVLSVCSLRNVGRGEGIEVSRKEVIGEREKRVR